MYYDSKFREFCKIEAKTNLVYSAHFSTMINTLNGQRQEQRILKLKSGTHVIFNFYLNF